MNNVFIYTTPHAAHKALADSLGCIGIQSSRKGWASLPFIGRYIAATDVAKKLPDDIDLILTESISTDLLAGTLYRAHRNRNTKLVALLTDPKIYELKDAPFFDKFLTYWSLKWATKLFVGSEMVFNLIPPEYKDKTRLFYPGIKNINKYTKLTAVHGHNFVFLGRLDEYKGTDILPKIFNNFRENIPDAKLYVAGRGQNEHLFKAMAQKNIFYFSSVDDGTFMHEFGSIYISAARYEPSGVAILEAMAQGLVPIVSEGVGYKSIVREVEPKLVVSTEQAANEIAYKLATNKKYWKFLSKKCKKVARKYSYKFMIDKFKKVLKEDGVLR
jgi:glycosyltransferase involved in cell wall biosynthesis